VTGTDREALAIELQELVHHIRSHVPDAVLNTRLAHADQHGIVIHAQIVGTNGVSGGAHAHAGAGDFAAELAENRAIARAMIAIGIPPVPEPIAPTRLHSVPAGEAAPRVVPFPSQEQEPESTRPEPEIPKPPPAESAAPSESAASVEDPLPEDISWTAFWMWAKANGFPDKTSLETAIGQPIDRLMPSELRKLAQATLANR
jgi:hypothetical protein